MGDRVSYSSSSAPCSVFMADKEKLQGDSTFRLRSRTGVENVYSEAISVLGTSALGARRFSSRPYSDYVAGRRPARLNVGYCS
jgi:hypothetical protein